MSKQSSFFLNSQTPKNVYSAVNEKHNITYSIHFLTTVYLDFHGRSLLSWAA